MAAYLLYCRRRVLLWRSTAALSQSPDGDGCVRALPVASFNLPDCRLTKTVGSVGCWTKEHFATRYV